MSKIKIDFPRLPLTHDRELFAGLADLGGQLVDMHLTRKLAPLSTKYPQSGDDTVARGYPQYREERVLSYADIQHYQGVGSALRQTMLLMDQIDELIPAFPLP